MARGCKLSFIVIVLILSSIVYSYADTQSVPVVMNVEPAVIDVTVPASLSLSVDQRGNVLSGTNAKIINHSKGAVLLSGVDVVCKNGWSLVSYTKDFSGTKVGTKEMGFKLGSANVLPIMGQSKSDGTFEWLNKPVIRGKVGVAPTEYPLVYDATLPTQKEGISNLNVADVWFTIDWYQ